MELSITLPEELADKIICGLDERANVAALTGNRWVSIKLAAQITGRTRACLRMAMKAKQLAHYSDKGKPQFKVCDLWAWMDLTRVDAKTTI